MGIQRLVFFLYIYTLFYFQSDTHQIQRPVTQLLDSPWTLQPPRLQTQIHNPQGLKDAVNSARHYDGLSATGTKVPSFLPFSGNFILDASFTLPGDADPLLERVRQLDQSQKAECADLAKQLIYLIEEADHFTYVRQGNGSQLTGLRTVTGWYFHYVCGASKEHFPGEFLLVRGEGRGGEGCGCVDSFFF